MRVAVMADCHIDHETHQEDGMNTWKRAVRETRRRRADTLILAGDFFHTGNPSGEALTLAAEGLRLLTQEDVKIVYLLGNHEWSRVRTAGDHRSAAAVLEHIAGVTVVDRPALVRAGPLLIAAMPWPRPGTPHDVDVHEQTIRRMADRAARAAAGGPILAAGHAAVHGLCGYPQRGSDRDMHDGLPAPEWAPELSLLDRPDVWHRTCLGHIHRRRALTATCGYVGSLEAWKFADEGQPKGFLLLDWTGSGWAETHIPVGRRVFKTLTASQVLAGEWENLPEGAVVRVKMEQHIERSEIDLRPLIGAGLRGLAVLPPEDSGEPDEEADEEAAAAAAGEAVHNARLRPMSYLREWLNQQPRLTDADRDAAAAKAVREFGWAEPDQAEPGHAESDSAGPDSRRVLSDQ